MTLTQSITISPTESKNEIIFHQDEFWSDEPPLESNLHLRQILLLNQRYEPRGKPRLVFRPKGRGMYPKRFIQCLEWLWQDRDDYFATGNLTIYYSPNQKKSEDFRGPDFFVVLGTTRNPNRRSWVVWNEGGQYPNVIVEILSDSIATVDRAEKKQIYQDIFRTPDYFWFDPDSLEFQGFTLISGAYQPIEPTEQGWLWSQQLGVYLGIYENKLRYFTLDGELVPTPEEVAMRSQKRTHQLEEKLRSLGVDPYSI